MNSNQAQNITDLEAHFAPFRENILGHDLQFDGPYGRKEMIYADWIASGRLYGPIEQKMLEELGPFVANTHTETSFSGALMTKAYAKARRMIKKHVNASENDVLIMTGTGMTGAVLKLQRILGFKVPEQHRSRLELEDSHRPVVFISHMEHHSNQTSWLETLAEVVQINPDLEGLVDLEHLDELLEQYADRPLKIASITSCSNVTGVFTPYYQVAQKMHAAGGYCFVDFACSGPYVEMDMHPKAHPEGSLDAIFFSPHKFLGGPGTPGVLVFNDALYKNKVPDHPGGGTVNYTNPWGDHQYITDIEVREDGGTPGFLQTIRAAFAMQLKEKMGVAAMRAREEQLVEYAMDRLTNIPGLRVLAPHIRHRLGAISFFIEGCHYHLVVSLLNDLFGIQTRGGCSCAGTYGHYLLEVDRERSMRISQEVEKGRLMYRPGWVRLSLHPTLTDAQLRYICDAVENVARDYSKYEDDYYIPPYTNEYRHKSDQKIGDKMVDDWLQL